MLRVTSTALPVVSNLYHFPSLSSNKFTSFILSSSPRSVLTGLYQFTFPKLGTVKINLSQFDNSSLTFYKGGWFSGRWAVHGN